MKCLEKGLHSHKKGLSVDFHINALFSVTLLTDIYSFQLHEIIDINAPYKHQYKITFYTK